jgi:glutamyl-tRNA synthetase
MIITRFSPSPTGYIHVGNIRTALINFLFAKKENGKVILRLDDTDPKRCKDEYRDAIVEDLKWLGLDWDEFYKQSDKLDYYQTIKEKLIKNGKLYACFETEDELSLKRKTQLSQRVPPIYDRGSLKLSEDEKQAKQDAGIAPHYRFLLDDNAVSWIDGIRGEIKFEQRAFSDPVVFRANGSPTYTFCSVIDDIDLGVTDVIRGEDHITNTAVQINIFKSLTDKLPTFHHLSLLKTKEAEISKRHGGFDIRSLKESGIDKMAICSLLSRLGSSLNVEPCTELSQLSSNFAMSNFSNSAIIYNEKDLINLNRKIIVKREFKEITEYLEKLNIEITEDFWLSIRENISTYNDVKDWYEIFHTEINPEISNEDKTFLKTCAELLPQDLSEFKTWINSISEKTDKKGRDLYHPLRLALTGKESGPELSKIVPLLGKEKVKERLAK